MVVTALATYRFEALLPGLYDGLREHLRDLDRCTTEPLTLVCRLHEGVDLQGLLRRDRRHAAAEEHDDLDHQRSVAFEGTNRRDALRAEGGAAIAPLPLPNPPNGANAVAGPS